MPAAALAAPVWSPDTDPAHTRCRLLDCLLAAFGQADTLVREWLDCDREPDGTRPPDIAPATLRTLRTGVEATQNAVWLGLADGVRERLSAAAVARLVRAGDAAATAQAAVVAADRRLYDLGLLPVDQMGESVDGTVMTAEAARAGLAMALAGCGEPPPPHDWRGIADPVEALPAAYRPRSEFLLTVPPSYSPPPSPILLPADAQEHGWSSCLPTSDGPAPIRLPTVTRDVWSSRAEGLVELHSANGPGADHSVRWNGRVVKLNGVQFRVVSYMWPRDVAGFEELAAHVNEHRKHATPTPETFKTWVCRGNTALQPLGLPRRLRADTVNRKMYWEDGPAVRASSDGFRDETVTETATPPA